MSYSNSCFGPLQPKKPEEPVFQHVLTEQQKKDNVLIK